MAAANGIDPLVSKATRVLTDLKTEIASAGFVPPNGTHPVTGNSACPVHLVRTAQISNVLPPFQGPKLRELRDFIENYLAGRKESTDHDYYRIDNGEKVKFPNEHEPEAKGYEFKNILHKAGMTRKEFKEAQSRTKIWKHHVPRDPAKPAVS